MSDIGSPKGSKDRKSFELINENETNILDDVMDDHLCKNESTGLF